MRWALFAAAVATSAGAGAGAAVLDIRAPHVTSIAETDPAQCEPIKFNIFFEHNEARLTEPAEHMLDMVGGHVHACAINSVAIEMPANEVASADGRRMAGERGAAILKALHERGVTADAVVVSQSGAVDEPADAAPPHVSVAIDASKNPLSVDRGVPGDGRDV